MLTEIEKSYIISAALFIFGLFVLFKMLEVRTLKSAWQKFWLVFWSIFLSPLAGALYLWVFVPENVRKAKKY